MLVVVVAPHGFTTACASEASIVPRASHRRITPAACLGRVLGAEPQVRSCSFRSHSYSYSFVSRPPSRTGRAACHCIRLSRNLLRFTVVVGARIAERSFLTPPSQPPVIIADSLEPFPPRGGTMVPLWPWPLSAVGHPQVSRHESVRVSG